MRPYAVYMHYEVLEALPKQRRARLKVLNFIEHLAEHPYTTGD